MAPRHDSGSVDGDFDVSAAPHGDAAALAAHPSMCRPRDPAAPRLPRVHRAGRSRIRVLVATSTGIADSFDVAEHIADDLATHTGRGVVLDIAFIDDDGDPDAGLPAPDRMAAFDVVVATYGPDAPTTAASLTRLRAKESGVAYVDAIDRSPDSASADSAPFDSAPFDSAHRATRIVDLIAPIIGTPSDARSTLPFDAAARQRAVDRMAFDVVARDARLNELVRLARLCYGTSHAELNIIDGDRHRTLVASGTFVAEQPVEDSICVRTLELAEPLVIADPARFVGPMPGSDEILSFYAGVQLESADGRRLGTVCVYDSVEVDESAINTDALGMIAAQIEQRLLELVPVPRRRARSTRIAETA